MKKQKTIYEVRKFGTTIEWTNKFKEAEAAFNGASRDGVELLQMDRDTGKKFIIRSR